MEFGAKGNATRLDKAEDIVIARRRSYQISEIPARENHCAIEGTPRGPASAGAPWVLQTVSQDCNSVYPSRVIPNRVSSCSSAGSTGVAP